MMTEKKSFLRKIRSFVRRDGRMTEAQRHALEFLWPRFGLQLTDGFIQLADVFQRHAPCVFEIGFGSGYSLLEMAKAHPEQDFIGVEMYQPGIGTLLLEADAAQLRNLRVYYADAVEILTRCIPDHSLDTVQIFFPDPWPKRKHHKRRLIQEAFVKLVITKLKPNGMLHLATDWEHYAEHMMKVLSAIPQLKNIAGAGQYADRSAQRPVVTKFERRGEASGRKIFELQFIRES